MSHIRIDSQKALKKWSPVLENMGITDSDRLNWMSEYAEFHSINENAYVNAGIQGMGTVTAPLLATFPGQTYTGNGTPGSGDVAQNLLPVAMKIAAQTIGLDLVSVKPTPGPRIELLFIDFRYDDVNEDGEGRPQVFKVDSTNLSNIKFGLTMSLGALGIRETTGGLSGARAFDDFTNVSAAASALTSTVPTSYKNKLEFLGFSRIDGLPMYRAFRQANAVGSSQQSPYTSLNAFVDSLNTFNPTQSIKTQLEAGYLGGTAAGTVTVELVSALEDHIPGFSANWTGASASGDYPMNRDADDNSYAGVIGPKVSTKSVAVGTIEVSSALRRTEIEDIKANTGMDITQKMESILVNELSQTISKQIVFKIFEMGALNRASAPLRSGVSIFDYNTAYSTAPGGETTHAYQRKLITKMVHASNFIATEGRVGPAQFAVTNGGLAASLMDIAGYTINPLKSKISGSGQLYPVGQIGDITVYVDPYMKYNDNRIVIGRKNNPDQPGIIFVPYLMAQSISIISEATFAPRMLLRSRYAVTEVGWYPQKQYMTINVTDTNGYLN